MDTVVSIAVQIVAQSTGKATDTNGAVEFATEDEDQSSQVQKIKRRDNSREPTVIGRISREIGKVERECHRQRGPRRNRKENAGIY